LWNEPRGSVIGPNKFLFRRQTVPRVYTKVLCVRSSLSILEGAYRLYDKGRTSLIRNQEVQDNFIQSYDNKQASMPYYLVLKGHAGRRRQTTDEGNQVVADPILFYKKNTTNKGERYQKPHCTHANEGKNKKRQGPI